jgi:transcriptional regulator with PAS, ATPase and Fis domain
MITVSVLTLFLDSLEEGVLLLDDNRHVMAVNQAAMRMIGSKKEKLTKQLCPSVFKGTECARACEKRGYCAIVLTPDWKAPDQDIVLKRLDNSLVFLRMWAISFPPTEDLPFSCAIILRDRSHEIKLEQKITERMQLGSMVGHSPVMQRLYTQIMRAAHSEASVLVTGESGTGKELVAKALHMNSDHCNKPYVPVHCASLPESLLESELFGYAKGAFTGATSAKIGRFEAAEGGTLLLDEIGEIPLGIQVKLLRVLQEREVVRLGENTARPVNVRVIASTHRNLAAMVERGEFREDLYYRLRVLPLYVPALRDRKEDISMIANKLLIDLGIRYKRGNMRLSDEAIHTMEVYDWPGNIRQLLNALEFALVNADGQIILPQHLPPEVQLSSTGKTNSKSDEPILVRPYYRPSPQTKNEMDVIARVLVETGGNKAEAARRLGMSRTSLWKRLSKASDKLAE